MRQLRFVAPIALACGALSGCATQPEAMPSAAPAIPQTYRSVGYLSAEALPDSRRLSPPPPVAGSSAQALDDEISRMYLAMEGSPRWQLAAKDAVLEFPEAANTFACALNTPITQDATPVLYRLLQRSLIDAGRITAAAKGQHMRPRPFMVNGRPTCSPAGEPVLRTNGSYPSGHASAGWAWALILAEIAPDRANEVLARGRAFAQSRVVCNVHWYSDTMEGTTLGSAAVARMHAEPAFVADIEAARKELANVRAKGTPITRDCAVEAAALKQ